MEISGVRFGVCARAPSLPGPSHPMSKSVAAEPAAIRSAEARVGFIPGIILDFRLEKDRTIEDRSITFGAEGDN